jgi:protoporphyrinogen/coproporphyrinogen III oxidase
MPTAESATKRIAVIGGGISGLAAAHRVRELNPDAEITLFEASDRLGGSLATVRQDGLLIEQGADSFITDVPWAVDLCRRIGLAEQLIPTNSAARGAMVVARGRLERVPDGFLLMAPQKVWPILCSPILSLRGKARLAGEYIIKSQRTASMEDDDESVASFVRRRLGREAFDRIVQPLVGGIYTADPEKLSLAATLPRFLEMERNHGGLIRGARAKRKAEGGRREEVDAGARYSMFVAPREGMASFVETIAARLPPGAVRLNTKVERIEKVGGGWMVVSSKYANRRGQGSEQSITESFDGLIVATPTSTVAKLFADVDSSLADELRGIEFAGSAVVALAYDRKQIKHPLDSFGFVVPTIERRRILSASFSSVKFPGRAPAGKELFRVFLGGALQANVLDVSDEQLCQIADEELRDLLGITGKPCLSMAFRWPASMPQYHLGHLGRVRRIKDRLLQLPGLALAGNAYEGVGIPQCVRSGEQAAERILAYD